VAFSTPPELIEPARNGDAGATERLIEAVWADAVRLATAIVGALQFGQKLHIQVFMDPTVPEMRSAAAAADFPVQFPAGLPANSVLRQLLSADHDTIMLQYGLPGAWRRKGNTLWIVLANPKSVTGSSDEQSVGHILALGPKFGPGGKVQERWQIGGEAVIIAQSEALPQELSAIKHAMLAQLARSCGTHARRSKTVVIQYARCR